MDFLLCLTCVIWGAQDRAAVERLQDQRLIDLVRLTPASDLDKSLPKIRFERWLQDVAGKAIELRWELNDCGEQTGDPAVDRKRDIPACVEAAADLPGERGFAVHVQVGTFSGKRQKPAVRGIFVQLARRLSSVEKLRDLPSALASEKKE